MDKTERDYIVDTTGNDYFVVVETPEGSYFVIGRKPDGSLRDLETEPCSFLTPAGACSIQHIKPLDCRAYPLRAVPQVNGTLSWHIHRACPAVGFLSEKFLEAADHYARLSASRFPPHLYENWLKRFSSWTLEKDAVLREREEEISDLRWWHAFFADGFESFFPGQQDEQESLQIATALGALAELRNNSNVLELAGRRAWLSHASARSDTCTVTAYFGNPSPAENDAHGYKKGGRPPSICADYRLLPFDGEMFELVLGHELCIGLWRDEQEDRRVLQEVKRVLRDTGTFVLSLPNLEYCVREELCDKTLIVSGKTWGISNYFDPESRRWIQHRTRKDQDGNSVTKASNCRLYTWPELSSLLRAAGFKTAAVYGGLDGSKLSIRSQKMVVLARA
ncbi:MAG: class I SAM-dependent methyltransferase [Acidobacteria bacterium]|nr:class I SAM-dependent methyltransferase [Acidobacteriota bacterium]